MRIAVVAVNTFREAVRNKVLHAIFGLALAIILGSKAMAWVSAGEDMKVMTDLGLAAITFFGVVVALFSGANLLYKEVDRGTSYLILTKPVNRYEFIIGKYFGLILVLLAYLVIMSLVHAGYLSSFLLTMEERPQAAALRAYYLALSQAYFLIFLELAVISAFAVFFSCVSSPTFSAIATFCMYFIGHGLVNIKDLAVDRVTSGVGYVVLQIVYWVLPALFHFDMKHQAAYGDPQSAGTILLTVGYAVAYCTVVIVFSCAIFRRKQL